MISRITRNTQQEMIPLGLNLRSYRIFSLCELVKHFRYCFTYLRIFFPNSDACPILNGTLRIWQSLRVRAFPSPSRVLAGGKSDWTELCPAEAIRPPRAVPRCSASSDFGDWAATTRPALIRSWSSADIPSSIANTTAQHLYGGTVRKQENKGRLTARSSLSPSPL